MNKQALLTTTELLAGCAACSRFPGIESCHLSWGALWWNNCLWVIFAPTRNPNKTYQIGFWWCQYFGFSWAPCLEWVECVLCLSKKTFFIQQQASQLKGWEGQGKMKPSWQLSLIIEWWEGRVIWKCQGNDLDRKPKSDKGPVWKSDVVHTQLSGTGRRKSTCRNYISQARHERETLTVTALCGDFHLYIIIQTTVKTHGKTGYLKI